MKVVRDLGMKPRTDADLLPVLLDLIGTAVPLSQWPGKMTKAQRTARAREIAQATAAAADRPQDPGTVARQPRRDSAGNEATALAHQMGQSRTAAEAVASERRRRGDGPPQGPLRVPGRLGASFWKDNPFVPPAGDEEDPEV